MTIFDTHNCPPQKTERGKFASPKASPDEVSQNLKRKLEARLQGKSYDAMERKYSPDQERDENGRFGSGGVGSSERIGGTGMPHPTGRTLSVTTSHNWTKEGMAQAKEKAVAHAAKLGFTKAPSVGFPEPKEYRRVGMVGSKIPATHSHVQTMTFEK